MNVLDFGLDDEVVEQAFANDLISEWDRQFCLGLINFANMTPKQEQKAKLVLKKIERGVKQLAQRNTTQPEEQGNFCSHCGHPLAT